MLIPGQLTNDNQVIGSLGRVSKKYKKTLRQWSQI